MKTRTFFSDSNHLSENGIALYVDAVKLERIDNLPRVIIDHVEECEECKMKVMHVVEIMAEQPYDETIQHPFFGAKELVSSPYSVVYRIAAVFVIAAFIGTFYYFLADGMHGTMQNERSLSTQQQTQTPVSFDSLAVEQKRSPAKSTDDLIAANSEPSANYEDLVQTQFRSTTFEIVSPEIGEIVQNPVTFRWKQYEKRITIKILSNKELTLVSTTLSGDSFTTSKKFSPGLYYWKLETDNELLFVGKFLVK